MKYVVFTLCLLTCGYANAQQTLYRYFDKYYWGLTNEKKEVVLAPEYDDIQTGEFSFIKLKKDGSYGLADATGKVIIPCEYTGLKVLNPVMVSITKGDTTRIMHLPSGKLTAPLPGLPLSSYYGKDALVVVRNKEKKFGVYNVQTDAMQLDFQYGGAVFYNDTIIPLLQVGDKATGYGVVNGLTGQEILPVQFLEITLRWDINTAVLQAKTTEKSAYYDHAGNPYTPKDPGLLTLVPGPKVPQPVVADVADQLEFESTGGGTWHIWAGNMANKKLALSGFSSMTNVGSKKWLVANKNGKEGVIDRTGKIVLPFTYDEINKAKMLGATPFSTEYYVIKKNNLLGLMNANDLKVIKAPVFAGISITREPVGAVLPDGRQPNIYNVADMVIKMALIEMPNGKRGFMNLTNGKVYIPGIQ